MCLTRLIAVAILLGIGQVGAQSTDDLPLAIEPAEVVLDGAEARQQLIVTELRNGREVDATERVRFTIADASVASVSSTGVVTPRANGVTQIRVKLGAVSKSVELRVTNADQLSQLHFARDIVPLLTRAGCNSGGCHGKQNGQKGFQLSVFGYDPRSDYHALVSEGRGRRLFPSAPERSLLLGKALHQIPHGGGERLVPDSPEHRRLLRWISLGMPWGDDDAHHVTAIRVFPEQRTLGAAAVQRLSVTAQYSDGQLRDVTHEALFHSNDETLAEVDRTGRVTTTGGAGESAIVVRYADQVTASLITVPLNQGVSLTSRPASWDRANSIDRLVAEKWERLGLVPSSPADEATLLRRLYLDLIGRLPTPLEAAEYLRDSRPDKRERLVDQLLLRTEYADLWALRWADLLRINREELGAQGAARYHAWLRDAVARNVPYDQFVRELIGARGHTDRNGAANFYRAFKDPNDLTVAISQVFLGVRLECARCHHHPYEQWSQDDFYGFAAFFPRIVRKPAGGSAFTVYVGDVGEVKHPKTLQVMRPRVLLGESSESTDTRDPRIQLADWMVSRQNPWVARTLVNRVWAHLMGRGLVEPVDDMRATNPASNEPLLAALSHDFVVGGYDIRGLIKRIVTSGVYGLSSEPNDTNVRDTRNHSRAYRKRLSAEVLLDAVCDVTGEAESFAGVPPGTRATQLWDHRQPSVFLDTFGRPQRKTVCQCERVSEATLGQILHLLNSPGVNEKISSPTGRAARLATTELNDDKAIDELYLAAYSRYPREEERQLARSALKAAGADRRQVMEDLLWALLNSAEFVLNH
ncbi:MAG: DUF1549 domain-containing protein [Pirellulales bacterium]